MHDERFEPTGDERVDRALMGLPHPEMLRSSPALSLTTDHVTVDDTTVDDMTTDDESAAGAEPADLDSQLADVTAVHRQLQQRLSDLAG